MRLVVVIKVRWWVRWYLGALATVAYLEGKQPDVEKAVATLMRHGIRMELCQHRMAIEA